MPADQLNALLDSLLSPAGWAYASTPPVDSADPGRFHALFGRDSLVLALQVLPERPEIARATLRALAELQGRVDDPEIEEQPGRIPHEDRPVAPSWLIADGWPVRNGKLRYYGSSDSTSWFLVLLDALDDPALRVELADVAQRAADWLERALDAGGGLVRCGPRRYPGGLLQQGWRDARDPSEPGGPGIVRADGSAPRAPLADADSQAVAVAALRALARLDPSRAEHWSRSARQLCQRLGEWFGPDVMAVQADGSPVPGAGSQLGWLLWADALPPTAAERAAQRLVQPDVLTAFGLRTLSADHPQFRADSYHRGSVWPFDCWLGWGGLRAHGEDQVAARVRDGVLTAVDRLGMAPELYAVHRDGQLRAIPMSNRVQAWTVGAALALQAGWDARPKTTGAPAPSTRAGSGTDSDRDTITAGMGSSAKAFRTDPGLRRGV